VRGWCWRRRTCVGCEEGAGEVAVRLWELDGGEEATERSEVIEGCELAGAGLRTIRAERRRRFTGTALAASLVRLPDATTYSCFIAAPSIAVVTIGVGTGAGELSETMTVSSVSKGLDGGPVSRRRFGRGGGVGGEAEAAVGAVAAVGMMGGESASASRAARSTVLG